MSAVNLHATHIIGGEMYYDCLGNGRFRITVKIYRDCLLGQAPFDSPLRVFAYRSNGTLAQTISIPFPGSQIIPPQTVNPCFQESTNICVEEAIYVREVDLPPTPGGYTLVYQRCCRNHSIQNIIGPGDTGATYSISIPESAWTNCNSSPRYTNFPPIVLCINDPFNFDHHATDPDGDQLVYELCLPLNGGSVDDPAPNPAPPPPYAGVVFSNPYSPTNPIPSNPGLAIDPVTGILSGNPQQLGQFVVAVCVSEYRNGQLLSVNRRDFQFNILNCNLFVEAEFRAPQAELGNGGLAPCTGRNVQFLNQSTNSTYFSWDFGIPNVSNDVSTLSNPIYVFPDTGQYTVSLIANPGYSCSDTAQMIIHVYDPIIPSIGEYAPQCITGNEFDFVANGQFIESRSSFNWFFLGPASQASSEERNPESISWNEIGTFPVILTVSDPFCTGVDTAFVQVLPEPELNIDVVDRNVCFPEGIKFTNNSIFSIGTEFSWDFGDGNTSDKVAPIHFYSNPGIYSPSVQLLSTIGCSDTLNVSFPNYIIIRPRPSAGLDASPLETSILRPEITFFDLSEGSIATWLYPGDDSRLDEVDTIYTYKFAGDYNARLVALNAVGCYDTSYVRVIITPIFTCYIPNAFTPNGDDVNDTFHPKGEGIKSFKMNIYDRWGKVVFVSYDLNEHWDGRASDGRNIAGNDVYNYKLWIEDVNSELHEFQGSVTLIR